MDAVVVVDEVDRQIEEGGRQQTPTARHDVDDGRRCSCSFSGPSRSSISLGAMFPIPDDGGDDPAVVVHGEAR
jgi:hypothetical protein